MGGIRSKGPLETPEDSHAIVEWAGRPGLRTVRKMIGDRLPFGVVEMKTAWMSDDPCRSRALAGTLARTPFAAMALLDAQFVVATAGSHVLNRWRSPLVDQLVSHEFPMSRVQEALELSASQGCAKILLKPWE